MAALFSNVDLKRNGEGNIVLKDKIIGIYFAAHWSDPCQEFTPLLKNFYNEICNDGFEIVFVSSDESEEIMKLFLKESHGSWLYVPFGHDVIKRLEEQFEVQAIPALIILEPNGTVILSDAYDIVINQPPKEALLEWQAS